MNNRYRLVKRGSRGGTFYAFDTRLKKRSTLQTSDAASAQRIINAMNEAHLLPAVNLRIARAYLMAGDAGIKTRTWNHVMEEMAKTKHGETSARFARATADAAFDLIRNTLLIETQAEHFFRVLVQGTVSTNIFLRRIHNFALAMNWLPCQIIPPNRWPAIRFGAKRAITREEHEAIVGGERNAERRAFYRVLWHVGGTQSDVANLQAEDIDWPDRVISFSRQKTGQPVILHFGEAAAEVLRNLPKQGFLFPSIAPQHEKHRAKEFKRRCTQLQIEGITLHSYRYAWAERAKTVGMPERFAQEALGHNSKAVHRAYSRKALVKVPSLEEYESKVVPMPQSKAG